jgi:hypothetical protein
MKFTTQNGQKEVTITEAPFKSAVNLKKAVMKCLLKVEALKNVDFNNLQGLDPTKIFDAIAQMIINVDTSDEFESCVMDCLSICIYDNFHKITQQLFDDKPETREDYYEIVSKCCEVNLRPFFKSLISELQTRFSRMELTTQEQK